MCVFYLLFPTIFLLGKGPRFVFQVYTTVIPQPSDSRYDVIGLDNATHHYTTDGIYLPELVHILASDLSSDIRDQASSTQSTTTSSTEEELEDRNLVSSEKNIVSIPQFYRMGPTKKGCFF